MLTEVLSQVTYQPAVVMINRSHHIIAPADYSSVSTSIRSGNDKHTFLQSGIATSPRGLTLYLSLIVLHVE